MNKLRKLLRPARAQFRYVVQSARCRPHVRPTDVFLATYPKSGTTWLAFLIANVMEKDPAKIVNLRNYLDYVPSIQGAYFGKGSFAAYEKLPNPRVFLGHTPYTPWFPNVVYLVRDPRDVLVSYWHHHKLTKPGFQPSLSEFIANDGDWWPGRWDNHVLGWLNHPHPHFKLVRYEDLHTDTKNILCSILDFAKIAYTPADIERALAAGKFSRMRSLEESFGVDYAEGDPKERFVRRGNVGGWRDEIDPATIQTLENKYRLVMERLGYPLTTTG